MSPRVVIPPPGHTSPIPLTMYRWLVATIICAENGKTYKEAEDEVHYAAGFVSWFAEEAPRAYGDTIPSSSKNTVVMTVKQPVGTCAIITP